MIFTKTVIFILIVFSIQGIFLGGFIVGLTTYLQNHSPEVHSNKIFSIYYMLQSGCTLPVVILLSLLLNYLGFFHFISSNHCSSNASFYIRRCNK